MMLKPWIFFLVSTSAMANIVLAPGAPKCVDPRGPITTMGPQIGMSPAEIQQARRTTGHVYCPGTTYSNGFSESAALIGDGGQILTTVRAFIDPDTNLRREPLGECIFMNQAGDRFLNLDFSKENGTFKFYTQNPTTEFYKDIAVVRTTDKLAGAVPFELDVNGPPLEAGIALYMVSAEQERMQAQMPPKTEFKIITKSATNEVFFNTEPIVQSCLTLEVQQYKVSSSLVYSSCASSAGAGGSILMIRLPSGHFAIKAILAKGGSHTADCKPFKKGGPGVAKGDVSYTFAIGIDSGVDTDLVKFQTANATPK